MPGRGPGRTLQRKPRSGTFRTIDTDLTRSEPQSSESERPADLFGVETPTGALIGLLEPIRLSMYIVLFYTSVSTVNLSFLVFVYGIVLFLWIYG